MTDPRLNSVHLDDARRQLFRRARTTLLEARGPQTIALENLDREVQDIAGADRTFVQPGVGRAPAGTTCWLADNQLVYPLRLGLNTVGRSPDNDVVVTDGYVSRRHCAILVHAGRSCELHDIASKNGTFLNGQRLNGPTALHAGDQIRMCDRQLTFMTNQHDSSPIHTQTLAE
jgi:hypothetical protein